MVYEIMKKEHLKDIEKLQQTWFSEAITYGFAAGTINQISEALTPYCLIAKDGENIIGYLMAEIRNDNEFCIFPDGVSYLEINDLYVAKEYRSHGIGKELLNRFEKIAREDGVEYIFLLSDTKDAEAVRKFYTSNGFTIWTTNFFKKLD